jgi:cytosine/adenosine deaminase-related metal-dependent hydrolase
MRKPEIDSGFYAGHGHERVQNVLGVGRDYNEANAAEVRRKVTEKHLDLVLIHVAEGKRTDAELIKEFDLLKSRGFLTHNTAVIHGVAFDKSDFGKMRLAATALVWSPQSNMIPYNTTTDVVAAFREGVSIALAPDWAPSGGKNMLAELQYAAKLNKTTLNGFFSNQQLFDMATSIPARIAHIDDKVGTIQPGLFADLFLLHGDATQPFDSLVQSKPQDIFTSRSQRCSGETKNLNLDVLPNGQKMEVYKLKLAKVDPCAQ